VEIKRDFCQCVDFHPTGDRQLIDMIVQVLSCVKVGREQHLRSPIRPSLIVLGS